MWKQNKWKIIISSIITLLPMLFGIIVWNKLPAQICRWKKQCCLCCIHFATHFISGRLDLSLGDLL